MTASRLRFLLPTILVLAGCGASSSSPSSTGAGVGSRTAPSSNADASASSSPNAATSSSRGAARPPSSGSAAAPGPGGSGGGAVNARVPADFELTLNGRLTPATISIPAFLAIALSVTSGDARPHTVLVRTPSPHTLSVPPHGHASLLIAGLRAGHYAVQVDGRTRAALVIGGEPGP